MKKSFRDIIDETFENRNTWDYYAASSKEFNYNPMNSIDNSRQFLKDFISIAGKGEGKLYQEINKLEERTTHVVSAFFIGHYIYNNNYYLKKLIDDEINNLVKQNNVKSDVCFSFVWFLTCLYHDLGYKYEDKKPPEFKDFSEMNQSIKNKLMTIQGIPKFYKLIYKNYFKFRIKEYNKNDHGIIGANLMFDSLYEIRAKAEKTPNKTQKKLCWEKELLAIYNFCSWNILGHNIWYGSKCKTYDVARYSKYKMKRLLLENNQKRIKLKEYPFFFFFCLIDTIEPYKKVLDYHSLNEIFLDLDLAKMKISTDLKCSCGQKIISQACGLGDWLTTSKLSTYNSVEIHFEPTIN